MHMGRKSFDFNRVASLVFEENIRVFVIKRLQQLFHYVDFQVKVNFPAGIENDLFNRI